MSLRLALLLVVTVAAVTGCRFDAAISSTATVLCATTAECPNGLVCSETLKKCIKENGDKDAPSLVQVSLTPQVVSRLTTATLQFSTNEALLEVPPLSVLGFTLVSRAANQVGEDFTFSYAAPSSAVEGAYTVTVHATDLAGNQSQVSAGVLTLDFTPPGIVPGSFNVSPELARPGETVLVQVAFTETLAQPPTLTLSTGTVVPALSAGGALATFQIVLAPATPDGQLMMTLSSLVDLAGNTSAPSAVGSIRVDTHQPRITTLSVGGVTVRSAVPGFNTFTIIAEGDVGTGDTLRSLEVSFLGTPLVCTSSTPSRRECPVTVVASMPEGDATVQALATDQAGNSAGKSTSVLLDFKPPNVVAGTLQPTFMPGPSSRSTQVSALGAGGAVSVYFLTSEPVSGAVVMTLDGQAMTCTPLGLSQTCVYTHACASLADGAHSLSVTLIDGVGNSFSGAAASTPIVSDCLAPAAPLVAGPGKLVWQRAPFGADWSPGVVSARLMVAADAVAEPTLTMVVGSLISGDALDAIATGPVGTAVGATILQAGQNVDRVRVSVQTIDGAGNGSPVVQVRENVATVSFFGSATAASAPPLWQGLASEDQQLSAFSDKRTTSGTVLAAMSRFNRSTPGDREAFALADLGNSKVLLFGGRASGNATLDDSWVFDGLTNQWSPTTGNRPQARFDPGLISIGAGKALLFGGSSSGTWLFDLATNEWKPILGAQPPNRSGHPMANIVDGMVLLFGGNNGDALGDTWLFDVPTERWTELTQTGEVVSPRSRGMQLTALGDGTALLTGGLENDYFSRGPTYLFDASTKLWSKVTVPSGDAARIQRTFHSVVSTATGQAVLVGGTPQTPIATETAWRFDTSSKGFIASTGPQPAGRDGIQLANLGGGKVVSFGGANSSNQQVADSQVLDVATLLWSPVSGPQPQASDAAFLSPLEAGRALYVLGPSYTAVTWTFDVATNRWSQVSDLPWLEVPRAWEGTSLDDGRLLRFGTPLSLTESSDTWVRTGGPSGSWSVVTSVGPAARSGARLTSLGDGRVLLFGGSSSGTPRNDTWLFSTATLTWSQVTGLTTTPPAGGSLTRLGTGRAVLTNAATGVTHAFDGSTNQWALAGAAPVAAGGFITLLPLGTNSALSVNYTNRQTWRFDGTALTWSQLADVGSKQQNSMVPMATGEVMFTQEDAAWRIDETTKIWAPTLEFPPNTFMMSWQRRAARIGSHVVMLGGMTDTGGGSSDSIGFVFDPATNHWAPLARSRARTVSAPDLFEMGAGQVYGVRGSFESTFVLDESGESATAVGTLAVSALGVLPTDVTGARASVMAGADGFTRAGAAQPGVDLQLYGTSNTGALFQTCASGGATAAAAAAVTCSTFAPFTGRTNVALRVKPKGFSNMRPVGLTVNAASLDVRYR